MKFCATRNQMGCAEMQHSPISWQVYHIPALVNNEVIDQLSLPLDRSIQSNPVVNLKRHDKIYYPFDSDELKHVHNVRILLKLFDYSEHLLVGES